MKIFLILLAISLQISAAALSQEITLSVKNEPFREVMQLIRKQGGYQFLFKSSYLKDANPVTLYIKRASIDEVLKKIFENQPFTYNLKIKTVIIQPKKEEQKKDQLIPLATNDQNPITINGKVVDQQGQPISGVNIRVKDSQIGTITDHEGNYTITVESNSALLFSYVGYLNEEVSVKGRTVIDVRLKEQLSQLDETVVKGYYNTTKKFNTGSISSIKAEDLARQPISDPINALIGRVPGLLIQQVSGVPGRAQRIRLRGQNSLENGSDPLFIVDGIQYNSTALNNSESQFTIGGFASPFDYLNIEDIESIDVLKDADATSLYGSRGANGVVLISTKKGKQGQTQYNFNNYTGFSKTYQKIKQLTTPEYLKIRDQAFINDKTDPQPSDYDVNGTWDRNRSTDWQEYLIGKTSPVTQGSVSINGGSQTTTFRLGGTYRKEGTIFPGRFSNEKGSGNINLSHKTLNEKFVADFNASYVQSNYNLPVGNAGIEQNITLSPNAPSPFNSDGSLNWEDNTWNNPLAIYQQNAKERSNNLFTNLVLKYRFLNHFELKSNFGYNHTDFDQKNIQPYSSANPFLGIDPITYRTNLLLQNNLMTWNIEPQISYSSKLLIGNFEGLMGISFQSSKSESLSLMGYGYQNDAAIQNLTAAIHLSGIQTENDYKYNAIYARLGYNIHNKYILNFTGRRDGSSRFGPDKRFGNFGSLAAAWIFSDEKNIKKYLPWLNNGKLRASYGTAGNDQIGDYKYLDTYTAYTILYQSTPGYIPTQLTNPFYGWERVNKLELGLELDFLNNRFSIEANFYRNRTKNQLVLYGLPVIAGFTSVRANIPAVLENKGIEVSLTSLNIQKKYFRWTTNFNITFPKNKLVSYPNIEGSSYANRYVVGKPTSISFRYVYQGKDPSTGEFKFADLNKDGSISSIQDQIPVFVGQKYFGGLQNNLSTKGFELDFFLQFTKQNGEGYFTNGSPRGYFINQPKLSNEESFTQPYTQNNTILNSANNNFLSSDAVIKDASFISLRNLSLSYSLLTNKLQNKSFKNITLYLEGQNVFILSGYTGFNPEAPSSNIVIPPLKTWCLGIRTTL